MNGRPTEGLVDFMNDILNKEIIETEVKMTKEEKRKMRELIKATEEYLAKLPEFKLRIDSAGTYRCMSDDYERLNNKYKLGLNYHLSMIDDKLIELKKKLKDIIKNGLVEAEYERFMNEEDGDD